MKSSQPLLYAMATVENSEYAFTRDRCRVRNGNIRQKKAENPVEKGMGMLFSDF